MLDKIKDVASGIAGAISQPIQSLQQKVTNLENKVSSSEQNCATSENELMSFESEKSSADGTLNSKNDALTSAQSSLANAQAELDNAQNTPIEEIKDKDGNVKKDSSKRDVAIKKAQAALEKAKAQVKKAQEDKDAAQKDVDKLKSEIEKTQGEIDKLKSEVESSKSEFDGAKKELSTAQEQQKAADEAKKQEEAQKSKEEKEKPAFGDILEKAMGDFIGFIKKDATEDDVKKLANSATTVINKDKYDTKEVEEAEKTIKEAGVGFYDVEKDPEAKDYLQLAKDAKEYLKNGDEEKAQKIKDDITQAFTNINLNKGVSEDVVDAIKLAHQEIGVGESGGDNLGEMLKYGGAPGDAWCASFVSWAYGEGQGDDNKDTFDYDIAVRYLRADAQKAGYYSRKEDYDPVAGDLIIQEDNGASHTGMVVKTDDKYIYTIEGNAGDKVRAKKYLKNGPAMNKTSGYIRMNEWKGSNAKPLDIDYLSLHDFEDADKNLRQSTV